MMTEAADRRPVTWRVPVGDWTILLAILVAAATLRFYNLEIQSIWSDEAASLDQADGTIAELFRMTADDNYPPLHNVLLFGSIRLFGNNEFGARLPSVLLSLLDIVLAYLFGAAAGYRRAGLIASAILAFSTLHFLYSQEARMYALLSFSSTFLLLSSMLFIKIPDWKRAGLVLLSAVMLLYTHPFGLIDFAAIGTGTVLAVLLWQRRRWRILAGYCGIGLASLGCFAPWALIILERARRVGSTGFWIDPPTPAGLIELARQWGSGSSGQAVLVVGLLLLVVSMLQLFWRRSAHPSAPAKEELPIGVPVTMLLALALLPFVVALTVSYAYQPLLLARYLIGSLPAAALLAGLGFARIISNRWAIMFVLVLIAMLEMVSLFNIRYVRDDWRGLAARLEAKLDPAADCLVIYPGWAGRALQYYYKATPNCVFRQKINDASIPEQVENHRVFLVQYLAAGVNDVLEASYQKAGYQLVSDQAFVNPHLLQFDPSTGIKMEIEVWGQAYISKPRFQIRADQQVVYEAEAMAESADKAVRISLRLPEGLNPATITIALVNDRYGGSPDEDINLMIKSVTIADHKIDLAQLDLGTTGYLALSHTGSIYIATNQVPLRIVRPEAGWGR